MGVCATTVATAALLFTAVAQADPPRLTRIITDSFSNPSSQHATAVEPDTFAFGDTFVATAQVGRFFDGGASGIAFATTSNHGTTWTRGVLPNITSEQRRSSPFERVSDPSVAYDAKHAVWLISSIPIRPNVRVPKVYVSRSTNGGKRFGNPITVARAGSRSDFDKNWTACDNHPSSPFYGHCYTTFDDVGQGSRLKVSTSTNGGLTWGRAKNTANRASGLGGQPVVKPGGTVIVPANNWSQTKIIAFRSTNGGATWRKPVRVAAALAHKPPHVRTSPLSSAEIDGGGRVYVAWQDCRFRSHCSSNDIVISTSTTGTSWTAPKRVPIGTTTDGADHFIPGIAVKPTTSGSTARIGLTYYSYGDAACGSSCSLKVGYAQSNDGGASWSAPRALTGPFSLNLIAHTSQGRMVGDYISTSWVDNRAFGAFAVARKSTNGKAFEEGIFVPAGGLNQAGSSTKSSRAGRTAVGGNSKLHVVSGSAVRLR
ncbi:MAG: hypothetical protein AUG48_00660 [Actinobacteria bacterium 13_1_20CM_3_68_9]|nr:MAG: hypothetical protein AUG48_00660 [Actinobacteria bacterium 13_1_20CM_3_68_9]